HTGNSAMAIPFNALRAPNNAFGSDDPEVLSQLLDAEIHQANERVTAGVTANWAPTERLSQRHTIGLDRVSTHDTQLRPRGFALGPLTALSGFRWTGAGLTLDCRGTVSLLRGGGLGACRSWRGQSVTTEESKVAAYGTGFPGPGKQTRSTVAERRV